MPDIVSGTSNEITTYFLKQAYMVGTIIFLFL